jgi:hypothetical protein
METDDLVMLEKALDALLADAEMGAVTAAMDTFGWANLLTEAPEALPVTFRALGRTVASSAALHDVLWVGLTSIANDVELERTSVLIPLPAAETAGRADPSCIAIDGLLLGARTTTEQVVATCETPQGWAVIGVPLTEATVAHAVGLDAATDVQRVTATVDMDHVVASGEPAALWWAMSVARARRALSAQMCGLLAVLLDLARAHAVERHQFGRPVGSFQAVRHKLADAAVAVAAAEAVTAAAWEAEAEDAPFASLVSKAVASRSLSTVAAHTQQVLAGMGFTAEHPFHLAMKRAMVTDRVLGDAHRLLPAIGRELAVMKAAPRLVEL